MRIASMPMVKCLQFLVIGFFIVMSFRVAGQQTPPTNYPCDYRNYPGQACPDGCAPLATRPETGCACFDGLDNDGDGLRDAADPDCATYFGLEFIGKGSDCSITPPGAATPFDLVGPPVGSQNNTADTQSKVAVGDVDGNGIPDAVITSKWNAEVRIISSTFQAGLPALNNNQAINFDEGQVIADFRLASAAITSMFANKGYGSGTNDIKNLLFEHEVLIADIDRDGRAEVYGVVSHRKSAPTSPPDAFFLVGLKLNAYGAQGLVMMPGYPVWLGSNRPGTFGIADMDGDGKAEVYLRDRIFAAETGVLLASEGAKPMSNTALWDVNVSSAPVAVDIRSAGADNSVMELVVGAQIYKIPNLTNRSPGAPQALTLWRDMNTIPFDINGDGVNDQYFIKLINDPAEYGIDSHSSTSVADIDKDGFVDVVVTGALNSSSGRTTVFYWNVQDNTVRGVMTPNSTELGLANGPGTEAKNLYDNYLNGWLWGTGRVNIGDANTDGNLDMLFIAGNQLFCYTTDGGNNMIKLWERTINDSRSGILTVTIYDFDNDGTTEVVYRDVLELVIIDGLTGQNKLWSRICQSHTYTEGPIIADVNGDGNTDICVPCNFSDNTSSFKIDQGIQQQSLGQIRLYFSSGEWLPTRKVWNQPGYFVVNINDDLTLPFPQFDIATVFSGQCGQGPPGARMPFNVFLNQVPFLSATGCPVYPAPDLTFIGDDPNDPNIDPDNPSYFPKVFVESPICGNLEVKVGFNITNSGDLPLNASIPVSFYDGSPYDVNNPGTLLHSTTINLNNLQVGDTLSIGDYVNSLGQVRPGDVPFIEFDSEGKEFLLYVVLYNDGSVLPIDTLQNANNNGQVQSGEECDITNNFWPILVTPRPFTVNIDSLDDVRCLPTSPPSGSLITHISVGPDTVIDLSPYAFQWFESDAVTPIPGETNYNITDIPDGDYYVVISNVEKGCSTPPILGQVLPGGLAIPGLTVTKLSDQTTCEPPNGSLKADVVGGNAGFEFDWRDEGFNSIGVTGPLLENVAVGTYFVVVTETLSGCFVIENGRIEDLATDPDVQPSKVDVVNCLNASSGELSAVALIGSEEQDPSLYRFDWYFTTFDANTNTFTRGSILPQSNGDPDITGVDPGWYEVTITDISTGCTEGNVGGNRIEVLDATFIPEVFFTELAPQTSCDPLQPNGSLQADAIFNGQILDPNDFTFEWFEGQNTTTPHLGGTSGINGQVAINVKGGGQAYTVRITTNNQCSVIADTLVTEVIIYPEVALVTTPNSVCEEALGFTGSVLSTVTFGGAPVTAPTEGYTFRWYTGPTADPTNERVADLNTQNLTLLDEGFYTLVVTNEVLHCPSVASVEQVLSIKALPVITAGAQASTNCLPDVPGNGGTFVTDVDGNGIGAPYAFQWFEGLDETGTLINGATTATLSGIQGGPTANYAVLVRNNDTGCENSTPVNVAAEQVIPLLSAVTVPDNICDINLVSPGIVRVGAVNATIDNQGAAPITDFQFTWSAEEPGVDLSGINASSITQLDSGFYSLLVRNTVTGCVSQPITRFVPTTTTQPQIETTGTPSSNCLPTPGNGRVEVTTVDGNAPGANYLFQWYTGVDALPANELAGATQPFVANIQGGLNVRFTVRVVDQTNGCIGTTIEEVLDNRLEPIIQVSAVPNNICDDQLASSAYTGKVSSIIVNAGTGPLTSDLADYLYTWTDLDGNIILKDKVAGGAAGGNELLERDSGEYTLVVIHEPTGCVSNLAQATVTLDVTLPVIQTGILGSTNCVPGFEDGQGLVTFVDGFDPAVTPGYTYQWHTTQDIVGTALTGETAFRIQNRQGAPDAYYTVLVTDTGNGCQNTATVLIPDVKTRPVITLGKTDNTQCDLTPNGTAFLQTVSYKGVVLTRPDPFTGFTFAWGGGQTTNEIQSQAKGTYSLSVTSNVGCTSDVVNIDIDDNFVYPNTVFTRVIQTSCDDDAPNGELFAAVGAPGNTAGFNFSWFANGAATTPLPLPGTVQPGSPFHAINLAGNTNYTVVVENALTFCRDTATTFLQEILRIPRIAVAATDIVDCNTPGFVQAGVFVDLNDDGVDDVIDMSQAANQSRYLLRWFTGALEDVSFQLPETGDRLDELSPGVVLPVGEYSAFVLDNVTQCRSVLEADFVNGPPTLFDIGYNPNILPSSCGIETGAITAFVTTGGPTTAGYTFEWYAGSPNDPSATYYTNPPVSFTTPLPIAVDQYNLRNTGLYTTGPLPGMQDITSPTAGPTLYGRASGVYSVEVTRISDGCKEYRQVFLPFEEEPIILIADILPDDCLPGGDNGEVSVTIQVPLGNNASDYKIWLIDGSNPSLVPPLAPNPIGPVIFASGDPLNDRFIGLGPGIYTVVAQQDPDVIVSGCFSAPVTFSMVEALPPTLSALTFSANTNCGITTAGDGAIEITFAIRDNDPFSPNYVPQPTPPTQFVITPTTYTVDVLDVNDNVNTNLPGPFASGANVNLTGLQDGLVDVTVTSDKGCAITQRYEINPQPIVAELVDGDLIETPSLKCLPDGSIEVVSIDIVGGGGDADATDISNYEFRWFTNKTNADAGTNTLLSGQGDVALNAGGDYFDATALSRPVGTYWVVAEKTAGIGGIGCFSAPFNGFIDDNSENPTVVLQPFSNTACDNPNLTPIFEGSLLISVTNDGSMPSPSGYTYEWLNATASSGLAGTTTAGDGQPSGPDDDNPTGLEDGFYKILATNLETGCVREAQATIDQTQPELIIADAITTPQIICDPDGSVVVLEMQVNQQVVPTSDFEYFWYRGAQTTPVILSGVDQTQLNPANYDDMGAGTYNVVAVRVAGGPGYGCSTPQLTRTVANQTKKPVFAITPFVNTSCSEITFEGSLEIKVLDEGSAAAGAAGYQYTWLALPTGSPITDSDGNNGDGINNDLFGNGFDDQDNPTDLKDGVYRLQATNNTSGCISNITEAVITPSTTPVVIAKKNFLDRFVCEPAGRVFVTEVRVGSLVYEVNDPATDPAFPTEIEFYFYKGFPLADNSNLVLSGAGESLLDSLKLPGIEATTYYVVAQNKLGPGLDCKSVEENITITDRSSQPEFTITPTSNTSCDDLIFDGSLSIVVSSPGSLPATTGYDYTWVATALAGVPADSDPTDPSDNFDGDGGVVTDDGDNPTGLKDGVYTLRIVNDNTKCISRNVSATIGTQGRPNVTVSLDKMDKLYCAPSGKILVNSVTVGNTTFDNTDFTNFDFGFFESASNGTLVLAGNNITQLDSANYAHPDPTQSIKPLTNYYVVATNLSGAGLSCTSLPKSIQFNEITNKPIPSLTPFANSSCTDLFLNGAIKILAKDNAGPGVGQLYTYEYIFNDGINPPQPPVSVLNNNGNGLNDGDLDSLVNLGTGTYSFVVRNQVTQCETPAQVVIQYDPVASKPNVITVDKSFPIDCLGNGGEALVTSIRVGSGSPILGASLDPPSFLYDWYDNGTDPFLDPPPAGTVAPVIPDGRQVTQLQAGTYYVIVRDLFTDCRSTPTQVVINSEDIIYPEITIQQTVLQLSCDPNDGTAELQARADGNDDSNNQYVFTWFNSLDGTGTTVIDPWPGSQSTITELTSGNYSVTAFNSATGCESTKLYIIPPFDPKFFPKIAVSGDPQSSCLVPNGSVVVKVLPFPTIGGLTYEPPYTFRVDLFNGDQSSAGLDQEPPLIAPDLPNLPVLPSNLPPNEAPGSFIADPLDDGIYTVRLLDVNTGCIVVETTEVLDDRRLPVPKIDIENPLTNCDDRTNGQLSASADGRPISNYDFFWWSELTPDDTITTNHKLIGQDQGKYFVSIVNKASGCETLASEVIPVDQVLPPAPTIQLIQDQTICWEPLAKGNFPVNEVSYPGNPQARPNGWLRASVNGQVVGYRFDWYIGSLTNQQVIGLTPDTTGINYLHRPADTYTVKSTVLTTGCSNVSSLPVPDKRIIPRGIIATTPSFCEDARLPSGSVTFEQTNEEAVALRELNWYDVGNNAFKGSGYQVFELPPGFYRAEFISNEFCYNEAEGQIFTEILAYNLVSSNADGSNDTWIIDCISNFTIAAGAPQDNNVKIFNRYGVLVYEANGYNNNDVVFRGIGENGVYTMGTEVPDGTYFYVIDKRDGSKPLTGFLELVR